MTDHATPQVIPLELAEFRFADDEPLAGQSGVVMGYVIRHTGGALMFDTGFGFGSADVEHRYHPRAGRVGDVLAEHAIKPDEITAVANSHLHIDHAGQNGAFTGRQIHVQPAELAAARAGDYTILEWIDYPGADYRQLAGDHEVAPGIRLIATPGHTPGHQSLVIETPAGPVILAGQAIYSRDEWVGAAGAREGYSRAWDRDAYEQSVARLRALEPVRVFFAHDRAIWST